MSILNVNRRDFIKLTLAAGASAGAAGMGSQSLKFIMADAKAATGAPGDGLFPSNCNMCGGTSGIMVRVANGAVVKIEPNSNNPVGVCNVSSDYFALKSTGARICAKGNAGMMSLYDPDRVKRPLKRVGARGAGQWQEISWGQALDEIAAQLVSIRDNEGPDKLAWFTEDNSFIAIQEAFCNAYGTPNFFQHSNICDVARKHGYEMTLGFHRPIPDLRNTKYMLIFGWNPLGAIKWIHLPRILLDGLEKGAKLVIVDPRMSETAAKIGHFNGQWLPIRPGTDGALALALGNVIVSENLYDSDFVNSHSVGFGQYSQWVSSKTPEWAEGITGIPAATIRSIARELATTKPAVVDAWSGVSHHTNGGESHRAIAMLAGLIGQIDKPGTMLIPERKGPKFITGLPSTLPRIDGKGTTYPFAHHSGVYIGAREAMITGAPYRPKAAFFVFQNFVMSMPDRTRTLQALDKLDLIVSVDTHLSETAMMADYVIPGTNYLERYEILPQWVTFPVVSLRQPVVAPLHGQMAEYDFIRELAMRTGYNQYPFDVPYEDYLDDGLVAGIGIGLEDLRALPGATWIGGETRYEKHLAQGFNTTSGKFEFYSSDMEAMGFNPLPEWVPPQETPNADYPFYLINWKEALHTHSRTQNNAWLMEFHGENELWINTTRAGELGIGNGDIVTVENARASATAKARVTDRIHPDVVGMTHGFGHTALGSVARGKGTNDAQFVSGRADPLTGMAAHKEATVRVYR